MADEYIRLDTTIIAIDRLINEAATGTMARTLFKAKDTLYSQQRYVIDVQPVKRGKWLWVDGVRCSECNYKLQTTGLPSYCPNCGCRVDKDE
jgi:predicted Zn-ribbon and HTH transcriptional regulator